MKDIIYRPPPEDRKINCKDDFELCYLRHQYLRRVNYNPTEQEMSPYRKIIEYMARNTYYTYRYLFNMVGMEIEDIVNTSKVYIVEFIGLFEFGPNKNVEKYESFLNRFAKNKKTLGKTPTPEDIQNKNKADFTMFMKQRMQDLVRNCKQKAKNIKGFRVDEYTPFCGPNPPPEDPRALLEDNEAFGFKRVDNVHFRAVKKRCKADLKKPFQFAGLWYIAVPLEQRSLTVLDLAGAGMDPYHSEHNLNPEQSLLIKQEEKTLDKQRKMFKNYSKEEKANVIFGFIEKNETNPIFQEEISIAKRFLREMGIDYVTQNPSRF